jgi:hypothetical protein
MLSVLNTSSNNAVSLLSRSLIKNRKSPARSPRSSSRLRACWATQPAVGFAVTPGIWTRRVACSTTVKQYGRVSVVVSTLKKSQAKIPEAWVWEVSAEARSGDDVGDADANCGEASLHE